MLNTHGGFAGLVDSILGIFNVILPVLVALSLVFCDALILISGALWLHAIFGFTYRQSALLGFYPFLIGDILKIVLVGLTLPRFLNRSKQFGQV